MPFPSPPWHLRGEMWLSLFWTGSTGGTGSVKAQHPSGLVAAAFVDYRDDGVLAYRELLVARPVLDGVVPRVTIPAIWVDSVESRDGARALWAIPKELAALHRRDRTFGPVRRTAWDANIEGSAIAAASFTTSRGRTPLRTPLRFSLVHQRPGEPVVTRVSGSAATMPCRGTWDFGADTSLSWLHGRQPVITFHLCDFSVRFGG